MSDLKSLQQRALEIRDKYNLLNQQGGRDAWGPKEYTLGFVGDVGDLAKIDMAKEHLRAVDQVDEKLAHELCDCLWSILVLAKLYGVELEASFESTMQELEARIDKVAAA